MSAPQQTRVLLYVHGAHRWLHPGEAQRLLDTMPNQTCPKCGGAGEVEHPAPGRCRQCQGLGRMPA